jgi:hypothetical protein
MALRNQIIYSSVKTNELMKLFKNEDFRKKELIENLKFTEENVKNFMNVFGNIILKDYKLWNLAIEKDFSQIKHFGDEGLKIF